MKGFTHSILLFSLLAAILPGIFIPADTATAGDSPTLPDAVFIDAGRHDLHGPAYSGCGGVSPASLNDGFEQKVVELVNVERAAKNVPPLKRVSPSDQAARYHAADLGQDNYFKHDSYDLVSGALAWRCSWDTRINGYYSNWSWLGENIAAGISTPESAMSLWMNSPGHRSNILNPDFHEIGVGYFTGAGDYYTYWVQDFGTRPGNYPVIINGEAAATGITNVSLYIYGDWTEFRLRNDNLPWSEWKAFTNSSTWELPSQSGNHTVSAEMRTASRTAAASDTIMLDLPQEPALGNLPSDLYFTYNLPDHKLLPGSIELTPQNTGTGDTLLWEVTGLPDWLEIDHPQGATPDSFVLTPAVANVETISAYTATITVTVITPLGVAGAPHPINLSLQVLNTPSGSLYLPVVVR